ncbi:SulP family inorganic anion transporter [Conexibacter sp. JD483]|uniref:SulP family inorganic anion transporter n=1 Tax=unclassified Conexibacter TaxID=2627773 RepID=UPI002718F157|nr:MULTISPECIES: SulP family inorganic anion transporter [unclassified Conexibacter]MDO8187969.1 SulP family inorganic anion transporter [Conexibacter sp. CPCC 205706]MDO8200162.1 SulP family inorganic anion transporter [Conexibacter sp. CPCC 205762]MDR9369708.1 SulP family inorganic anion transporter [Conexibacter sp. JD483]
MRRPAVRRLLPSRRDYRDLSRSWPGDLLAGVTVAIVALPLALAFGVTSGLGAEAGIVTAIVAGIVAGVFGGSHVQVSGPTGAMTVVLVPVVASVGPGGVLVVALAAGLLLVAAGTLRLGRYAGILPWPVIEGFTLGIALLIFLQQVPAALGVPKPDGENTALVAAAALGDWAGRDWTTLALVALVAGLMTGLPRLHRALPASLFAVAAATALVELTGLGVAHIGHIPSGLPAPALPSLSPDELPGLLSAIVAVAALAAIESLLSAKVADGMGDAEPHDPDRELVGQGLANVAVSFFGGMPATGAIARTAVNVRSGARTRAATIVHGVVLAAIVLAFAPLIERIPLGALAGVLMVTAVRMVEFGTVARIVRSTRGDAALLLTTAAATVVFDLVIAVGVGVALAAALALRAVADSSTFDREQLAAADGEAIDPALEHALLQEHIVAYRLDGALFFGAAQRFLLELTEVTDVNVVILRLGRLRVLDSTGAQALGDLIDHLQRRGITVLLASLRPEHQRLLQRTGTLDQLVHENHVLPTLDQALAHAHRHVERDRVGQPA